MLYLEWVMNMINILLYISTGMIVCAYIGYILMIMIGRNKIVSKSDGFDVTKDIISQYNSINVIESSGYFTIYNIKRKVIKLATKCYYGKDVSSISLSLMEAGISVVDKNKNRYINIFRNIIPNLKWVYILPIISVFINNSSFNISDAKVSVVIIAIFTFIIYTFIDIKGNACYWVSNNIKRIKDIGKDSSEKIISFMNKLILIDKFIFFGELIMIIRFVLIMLEIN